MDAGGLMAGRSIIENPLEINQVYCGDCLKGMQRIADKSIDMILCDLPYGTTYAAWDSVVPMDMLWAQYMRVAKDDAAIVLTASQPFTALLVVSGLQWFRCEWIWDKVNATNFANAKRQPLKQHESLLIFGRCPPRYYPQKMLGKPNHIQGKSLSNKSETRLIHKRAGDDPSGMKYPKSIIYCPKHSSQCGLHPTQKPVALGEYLIKTYTNLGDLVLDNCCGSGSFLVAAKKLGRNYIGIDIEEKYCEIAAKRLTETQVEIGGTI